MYIFSQASSSEVSKINLEAQMSEMDTQITGLKEEIENLRETFSTEMLKSEESVSSGVYYCCLYLFILMYRFPQGFVEFLHNELIKCRKIAGQLIQRGSPDV